MSRSFAEWLTESRAKTLVGVVAAAVFALIVPFASWLPGALVVMLSLVPSGVRPESALVVACATVVALTINPVAGIVHGTVPWVASVLLAAALVAPSYLIGRLLARGASPNLAFQSAALAALGMLVVVYVVLADPAGVWRPLLSQIAPALDEFAGMMANAGSGHRLDEQQFVEASAARAWGVVAWLLLLNTMVSVLFGLAWARGKGYVPPGDRAFSALSAGRTLAMACVVAIVCTVAFASRLGGDALLVFAGVFMLQGLAIMHATLLSLGYGGMSLGVGYAVGFLVFLLLGLAVPALAGSVQGVLVVSGFIDNWWPLRARLAARPKP